MGAAPCSLTLVGIGRALIFLMPSFYICWTEATKEKKLCLGKSGSHHAAHANTLLQGIAAATVPSTKYSPL